MSYHEELLTEPDHDRVEQLEGVLLEIKRLLEFLKQDCSEADKVLCHARSISWVITCALPEWMIRERRDEVMHSGHKTSFIPKKNRVVLNYQEMREFIDDIDADDNTETGLAITLFTIKSILGDIIYKLEHLEEH